jgi:hypothetical protein
MEGAMENPKDNPKLPEDSGEKTGPKVIQRWSAARKREVVIRLRLEVIRQSNATTLQGG